MTFERFIAFVRYWQRHTPALVRAAIEETSPAEISDLPPGLSVDAVLAIARSEMPMPPPGPGTKRKDESKVEPAAVEHVPDCKVEIMGPAEPPKPRVPTQRGRPSKPVAANTPAAPANAELAENGARRSSGAARVARKKARSVLREKLKRGPRPEAEVTEALAAAAIDKRDALAACDDLGVVAHRGQWRLP